MDKLGNYILDSHSEISGLSLNNNGGQHEQTYSDSTLAQEGLADA
jgi:hypothetical protein